MCVQLSEMKQVSIIEAYINNPEDYHHNYAINMHGIILQPPIKSKIDNSLVEEWNGKPIQCKIMNNKWLVDLFNCKFI